LQETLELLPGALEETNTALAKSDRLSRELEPTLRKLNPGIKGLSESLPEVRKFSRQTTPIIKNQIRPFTVKAQPTVRDFRPAAADFAKITPRLDYTFGIINNVLNAFTYNPKGEGESYLFWALWLNHIGASVFATQDAHGPINRGVIIADCATTSAIRNLGTVNAWADTLARMVNIPTISKAGC
jgi:phospholipid/cholesterol/gamma-HCH transport system substrate-binding protein